MRGAELRPIVACMALPSGRSNESQPMDTWKLRYRHEPPRLGAHWLLLITALASLAMLVLACMLADPGSVPLR
jgi:hypothetical protein